MTEPRKFFDGHNDLLLRLMLSDTPRADLWPGTDPKGHLDLPRMKAGGFAGGFFAIFIPPRGMRDAGDLMAQKDNPPYHLPMPPLMTHDAAQPDALTMAGILHWMARETPEDFALCRSRADIDAAIARGAVAAVMHMEGAEAIGPDLDALYLFHDMGLRSLGPVWSRETIFGHGVPLAYPGDPDMGPGLTPLGCDLIRLCNELGILIDLSHLNEAGFNDVARLSDAPLVATHSNAHAICPCPRNLTDRQLGAIRDSGGMVGLNFGTIFLRPDGKVDPACGWDPMLRHLDYLIDKLGEDHVGLGSDFDGTTVPDVLGDVAGMPGLFAALESHGYGAALLDKLAMGNWLACLGRTFKA